VVSTQKDFATQGPWPPATHTLAHSAFPVRGTYPIATLVLALLVAHIRKIYAQAASPLALKFASVAGRPPMNSDALAAGGTPRGFSRLTLAVMVRATKATLPHVLSGTVRKGFVEEYRF